MKGIEFPEANKKLLPPEGEEANVYTLHVWSDGNRCISKWKMTWRERISALFTGVVWFDSWGSTHPPINLMVKYPFERQPSFSRGLRNGLLWSIPLWVIIAWVIWMVVS